MFLASWINFQKTDTDRESFWLPVTRQTLGLLNINKVFPLIRTFDDSLMDIIFIIILFSMGLFNTNLIALGKSIVCCYLRINKSENREIEWLASPLNPLGQSWVLLALETIPGVTPWLGSTWGVRERERWVREREETRSGLGDSSRLTSIELTFSLARPWLIASQESKSSKIFLPVFLRQTDKSCVNFYDVGPMMIMIVCIMYAVACNWWNLFWASKTSPSYHPPRMHQIQFQEHHPRINGPRIM